MGLLQRPARRAAAGRAVRGAFLGYTVAFLGTVAASLLAVTILHRLYPGAAGQVAASLPGVVGGALASSSTLLAVAVIGTRPPRAVRLRLARARVRPGALLAMLIGVLALAQALESLTVVLGVGSGWALQAIRQALAGASGGRLALAVLGIGLLAGFAEELFFRGFMQTRLREGWGPRTAIVVSALGFGLLHLDPVHGTLAFVLGLYLGCLTELTGSVVPAAMCHVVNDTISVLLTALSGTPTGARDNLVLLLGAASVFVTALIVIRRLAGAPRGAVGGRGTLRVP